MVAGWTEVARLRSVAVALEWEGGLWPVAVGFKRQLSTHCGHLPPTNLDRSRPTKVLDHYTPPLRWDQFKNLATAQTAEIENFSVLFTQRPNNLFRHAGALFESSGDTDS